MPKKQLDCWGLAEKVLPHTPRVLLYGVPGTGKSHFALTKGLEENQDVFSLTLTEETPAAEIRGHYVPKGQEFVFHYGPGIEAWKNGARLVINEIDHASGDLMSILLAVLDDPELACLTLPNGETVKPQGPVKYVATMNGVPKDLPDPLQDRFDVKINCDRIHPGALTRLPADLRGPAAGTVVIPDSRGASVRVWLSFANLREKLGEEIAGMACFPENWDEVKTALKLAKKKA